MKRRWRVRRWLAHSIPGLPSPILKYEGLYIFRFFAEIAASWTAFTTDGRGYYYGTLEYVNDKEQPQ